MNFTNKPFIIKNINDKFSDILPARVDGRLIDFLSANEENNETDMPCFTSQHRRAVELKILVVDSSEMLKSVLKRAFSQNIKHHLLI